MQIKGVGVDIVEVRRFRAILRAKNKRFLANNFSPLERAYCMSFRDAAPHFAGTFAAKEAVQKAMAKEVPSMAAIEIRRDKHGTPNVWTRGKRSARFLVSISHERSVACAVALKLV